MSWVLVLSLSLFALMSCSGAPPDYRRIHREAFVVDLHSDSIDRVLEDGSDFGVLSTRGHMDLPRLAEGGIDLQFFSIWVSPGRQPKGEGDPDSSAIRAHVMIDKLEEIVRTYPDRVALATTAGEAREIAGSGKIAAAMGLEGGHIIENSLEKLAEFHRRGVRYMTLTWNNSNDWADAAKVESDEGALHGGLTEFGVQVVKEMNRLGMIVDVSHVSEGTFWDVLEVVDRPVIASHSSVSAICPHYRNLKDEQIRAIAENGGMIGINFYPAYLDSTYNRVENQAYENRRAELDSLRAALRDQPGEYYRRMEEIIRQEMGGHSVPVSVIADHIDYIVRLVGVDYVGLGSDFDGVPALPAGLEDVTKVPELTRILVERGYDEDQIRKILGGNFMRVFETIAGS